MDRLGRLLQILIYLLGFGALVTVITTQTTRHKLPGIEKGSELDHPSNQLNDAQVSELIGRLASAKSRRAFLEVLHQLMAIDPFQAAMIGATEINTKITTAINDVLGSDDAEVRKIAITGLVSWSNSRHKLELLDRVYRQESDTRLRRLAVSGARGYTGRDAAAFFRYVATNEIDTEIKAIASDWLQDQDKEGAYP